MPSLNSMELLLIAISGAIMLYVLLKAIGQSAITLASADITHRRAIIAQRREEDAAAEAAGRAAALEPLDLNPDGSIVEPILALAEDQS
jgi:hypothetical protein